MKQQTYRVRVGYWLSTCVLVLSACGGRRIDLDSQTGVVEPGDGAAGAGAGPGSEAGGGAGSGGAGNELPTACEFSFPAAKDGTAESECSCTRRPGAGNSFRCPWGTGTSVTALVGPAGAVVQLSGTPSTVGVPVELRIPPGALSEVVSIRITETSIPPPDGIADWSPLYRFEPEDLTFATPVEVRIPSSSNGNLVPVTISIHWSDQPGACALAPLSDNYVNAGFNQGSVRHLGWAIVGVAPRDPSCP